MDPHRAARTVSETTGRAATPMRIIVGCVEERRVERCRQETLRAVLSNFVLRRMGPRLCLQLGAHSCTALHIHNNTAARRRLTVPGSRASIS